MHGTVLGDLTIDVVEPRADLIELYWSGASNHRDPATALRPFFNLLLAEATTRSARVELHFEKLTFFNSSTVAALIRFVQDAAKRSIKLGLFYDGSLRWQAHNFKTISLLHGTEHGVEVYGLSTNQAPEKIGAAR